MQTPPQSTTQTPLLLSQNPELYKTLLVTYPPSSKSDEAAHVAPPVAEPAAIPEDIEPSTQTNTKDSVSLTIK